jgi:hypothetical protein
MSVARFINLPPMLFLLSSRVDAVTSPRRVIERTVVVKIAVGSYVARRCGECSA